MVAEGPIGTIVAFAGPVDDTGGPVEVVRDWFLCNGVALEKARFPTIWNVIQTDYGNGSDDNIPATDFNLPDLRGVFLRGWNGRQTDMRLRDGEAGSRTFNNPGGKAGDLVGTFQGDTTGPHNHPIDDPGHRHEFAAFRTGGAGAVGQAYPRDSNVMGTESSKTGITIKNNDAMESRPKNVAVNYIIRVR